MELTTEQILDVWILGATAREDAVARFKYFDGEQPILDDTTERIDGKKRNRIVTNWIKYIVQKHVGFLTWKPITIKADESQSKAVAQYVEVGRYNNFPGVDSQHLRNAIITGSSVEVHGYDGTDIQIAAYDPRGWAFVEDVNGALVAAIYRYLVDPGTMLNGEITDRSHEMYAVYTDASISTFEQVTTTQEGGATTSTLVSVGEPVKHEYKAVPVVRFFVSDDRDQFITDDLLTQQDAYNKTRSSNADDVEYNADAFLKIIGYTPDAIYEKDANGKAYIEKMREDKIITLKDGGDAAFIAKGNAVDKVQQDLDLTRQALHIMGRIADTESIAGATGNTSGIALKLKLQPQIEQGTEFAKYFQEGIRARIDLINTINAAKGLPTLEDYEVIVSQAVPVNETEIWTAVNSLEPLMSVEDRLALIPGVEDPSAVAERKRKEAEEQSIKFDSMYAGGGGYSAQPDGDNVDPTKKDVTNV